MADNDSNQNDSVDNYQAMPDEPTPPSLAIVISPPQDLSPPNDVVSPPHDELPTNPPVHEPAPYMPVGGLNPRLDENSVEYRGIQDRLRGGQITSEQASDEWTDLTGIPWRQKPQIPYRPPGPGEVGIEPPGFAEPPQEEPYIPPVKEPEPTPPMPIGGVPDRPYSYNPTTQEEHGGAAPDEAQRQALRSAYGPEPRRTPASPPESVAGYRRQRVWDPARGRYV